MSTLNRSDYDLKPRSYLLPELVVFQADTPSGILDMIDSVSSDPSMASQASGFIKKLSFESQAKFNTWKKRPPFRAVITTYGEAELLKKLTQLRKMIATNPTKPFSHRTTGLFFGMGLPSGKIAYLYPGQGAQYPVMGQALARAFPTAARAWDVLGGMSFSGRTLREVVSPGDCDDEEQTRKAYMTLSSAEWTNACISVAGEAIFGMLDALGVVPDAVAGHSFGDVSSFRAAGILSAEDMVRITRHRGELGVHCPLATRGCILVVPESAERVRDILDTERITEAWIANYNTPSQTVLSGVRAAITHARETFEHHGIKTHMIPISAAPHCPLAVDVAEKLAVYLEDIPFHEANRDLYSFVFGRKVGSKDPALYRKILRTHCEKPVRFLQQINTMYKDGIRIFVEVAPSDILTGLVSQILDGRPHIALATDDRKGDPVLAFLNTVAELVKEGLVTDLTALWDGSAIPHGSLEFFDPSLDETAERRLKLLDLEFARIERGNTA